MITLVDLGSRASEKFYKFSGRFVKNYLWFTKLSIILIIANRLGILFIEYYVLKRTDWYFEFLVILAAVLYLQILFRIEKVGVNSFKPTNKSIIGFWVIMVILNIIMVPATFFYDTFYEILLDILRMISSLLFLMATVSFDCISKAPE